jgi:hypothetical protein
VAPDLQLGADETRLDGPAEEAVAEEACCGAVVDPGIEVFLLELAQFNAVEPITVLTSRGSRRTHGSTRP